MKDILYRELPHKNAIQCVECEDITVLRRLALHNPGCSAETSLRRLTPREFQIANMISESGATVNEIAQKLGMASSTVYVHKANLYLKLGVHSKAELVRRMMMDPPHITPPPILDVSPESPELLLSIGKTS